MIFPQLARYADVALLLLRIMVGIIFFTSGWKHLKDPQARRGGRDSGGNRGRTAGATIPCSSS